MKLIALDIPDDPAALAGWLEGHLTGLNLAAVVAELESVHGPASVGGATLEDVLGGRRGAVLERGLDALPPQRLRQLLRQPRLLLHLQELLLTEGGGHWRNPRPPEAEHRALLERGRSTLEGVLEGMTGSGRRRSGGLELKRTAWRRGPWLVGLAAAASVLVIVLAAQKVRQPAQVASAPGGWGWTRPDALPQDLPPAAYLEHLADTAQEWFKERPEDAVSLARRIAEFREGCSVLILTEHKPLAAEDRAWLVEKCRAWAARLDAQLAALEAGDDMLGVRAEADETIRKLIGALRERAGRSG